MCIYTYTHDLYAHLLFNNNSYYHYKFIFICKKTNIFRDKDVEE